MCVQQAETQIESYLERSVIMSVKDCVHFTENISFKMKKKLKQKLSV